MSDALKNDFNQIYSETDIKGPGRILKADPPDFSLIDYASSLVTYVGYAPIGALTSDPVWMIIKYTDSATSIPYTTTMEYAVGYHDRSSAWDDRATLNYVR